MQNFLALGFAFEFFIFLLWSYCSLSTSAIQDPYPCDICEVMPKLGLKLMRNYKE